jgi:uncharacterized membrane protein YoaK (UPF0700 family)
VLPPLLAAISGSGDVIGFLGFHEFFLSNMTGNIVVLVGSAVTRHAVPGPGMMTVERVLSLPVFIAGVLAAKFAAARCDALRLLLGAEAVLLVVATWMAPAPWAPLLGVLAMGVQGGVGQVALPGEPSTVVMTTNVTQFVLTFNPRSGEDLAGFIAGCAVGAAAELVVGPRALGVTAVLAMVALGIGMVAPRKGPLPPT